MVIIETPVFTRLINELFTDDEYKEIQESLVHRPDSGPVIPNGGGLRKLRWGIDGRGKSGGVRLIYYWVNEKEQIYMLLAYPKNVQENLTPEQLKALRKVVTNW